MLLLSSTLSTLGCSFNTPPLSTTSASQSPQTPQSLMNLERLKKMQKKVTLISNNNNNHHHINHHLIGYKSITPTSNLFEDKTSTLESSISTSYDVLDLKHQLISGCNDISSALSDVNKELYTG
jgi:hypothetical protein